MLTRFVESILPGLRDARTPLASGILWLLFGWMLLADSIPSHLKATGFVRQLYDAAQAAGEGYAIAVVGLVAYVLGIVGVTGADAIRNVIAWAWRYSITAPREWMLWQSNVRRQRRQLEQAVRNGQSNLSTAAGSPNEAQLRHQLEHNTRRLSTIQRAAAFRGGWTRRTPDALNEVGRAVRSAREDIRDFACAALEDAWQKGVDDELQRRNADIASHEFSDRSIDYYDRLVDHDLGPEPLDALRALDEGLYQAFDRERAEREFRIAVMPPTIAFAVYVGRVTNRWGYALAALGLATFVRAAMRHSQETTRVLNQIIVKRLSLPGLVGAERAARIAVRDYVAKHKLKSLS